MNINADEENAKHLSEDRLVEISRDTAVERSTAEMQHLSDCKKRARLLDALFRVQKGEGSKIN